LYVNENVTAGPRVAELPAAVAAAAAAAADGVRSIFSPERSVVR